MFNLGTQEILIIVVLALIFLGPKKLPELASGLGKAIREVRKATSDIRSEIELDETIRKPLEELREATMLHPEELKRRDREKAERALREREEAAAAASGASTEGTPDPDATLASDPQMHSADLLEEEPTALSGSGLPSAPSAAEHAGSGDLPPPTSFVGSTPSPSPLPSSLPEQPKSFARGPSAPRFTPPVPSDRTVAMPAPPPMESGRSGPPALPSPSRPIPSAPLAEGPTAKGASPTPIGGTGIPVPVPSKPVSQPVPLPEGAVGGTSDRPSGAIVSGTIKVPPPAPPKPPGTLPRKPANTVPRGTIIGMPAPNMAAIPGSLASNSKMSKLPPPGLTRAPASTSTSQAPAAAATPPAAPPAGSDDSTDKKA